MKNFIEVLKVGSEGELVIDLQKRLIELGFDKVYLKDGSPGILEETGYFGEVTEAAISSFQAKTLDIVISKGLQESIDSLGAGYVLPENATGEVDFCTHYALANYEKLAKYYDSEVIPDEVELSPSKTPQEDIVAKVVEIAKSQLNVVESKKNNMGEQVQEYQEIGSNGEINGGAPWCQYFQNWCLIKACEALELKYKWNYSGYTPDAVNIGKKKGITIINPTVSEISVGDWGFVYSASRNNAQHIYLIIGIKGNTVITIEGNTNPGGSSDGYGVFKRQRKLPWAIVKWSNLYK